MRIRFRIDGVLYDVMHPPMKMRDALISRIKIMSKLDISEKRLPQDGRIKIRVKVESRSRELDFRVSTLPTLFGEKVVLRLLDKEKLMLDMTNLGFEPDSLVKFQRNISKPYGMVLVTGPTGSGKTNTLYSALQSLNTVDTNIMTAEDPVEFNLPGINQVQMKEQIGLNFAAALRSFLRQDPNIVLVGEIRDFETAEIAIKAALTGHLVLSTLHTNDAPSTISRLMNMGIEPFLVATSVNLIQAQRLIRRVCKDCKKENPTPAEALVEIGFSPEEAGKLKTYKGNGCPTCNDTGYKGRIGLYEVMEITDEIRELILIGASSLELRKKAIEDGMLTLRESGLQKIRNGVTTIEEVLRETVA
jgi:type IV pilus assembly protein PilB